MGKWEKQKKKYHNFNLRIFKTQGGKLRPEPELEPKFRFVFAGTGYGF